MRDAERCRRDRPRECPRECPHRSSEPVSRPNIQVQQPARVATAAGGGKNRNGGRQRSWRVRHCGARRNRGGRCTRLRSPDGEQPVSGVRGTLCVGVVRDDPSARTPGDHGPGSHAAARVGSDDVDGDAELGAARSTTRPMLRSVPNHSCAPWASPAARVSPIAARWSRTWPRSRRRRRGADAGRGWRALRGEDGGCCPDRPCSSRPAAGRADRGAGCGGPAAAASAD